MKQVLQSLKDGSVEVAEVPAPKLAPGHLLIATTRTLVSAGTERMLVDFGRAGWIAKARQQPDKVREVLAKVRTDGLATTVDAVRSKLDQPLPLGYCNVGRVIGVGAGVDGFAVGDRVASNGNHAGVVLVPQNLCARIPADVSDDAATFTVLGAIGLQGLRLAQPTLGEAIVVTGLGLIGLMTVQMLRAQGCRVLGIDVDPARLALAQSLGAEVVDGSNADNVLTAADRFSQGRGVDAVIITASTKSNEPVSLAARMCRQRGRIVLVGVTGLQLSRADFYEKELTFQVSCSYGPGRYDPAYEDKGQDYPIGFVRWTEQRNFEAVLNLLAAGSLDVTRLITHRFAVTEATAAFDVLTGDRTALGILFEYPDPAVGDGEPARVVPISPAATDAPVQAPPGAVGNAARIAFIGAGNYGGRILIPAFKAAGAALVTLVSGRGMTAVHHGRKAGFENAASDAAAAIGDAATDTVVIATRHDAHAAQVSTALDAGKHVFCEKPLCLTMAELEDITGRWRPGLRLMVGFNRRFAPLATRMKTLLAGVAAPKQLILTINAGAIPPDHWTQNRSVGGGRWVGEGCHFVDFARFLVGHPITDASVAALGDAGAHAKVIAHENVTATLRFADGSVATIHYLATGNKGFPKERVEAFTGGRVLQLDNFIALKGWGWAGFSKQKLWRQDKGQTACAAAFVASVRQPEAPDAIPVDEIFEVSRWTIELADQL